MAIAPLSKEDQVLLTTLTAVIRANDDQAVLETLLNAHQGSIDARVIASLVSIAVELGKEKITNYLLARFQSDAPQAERKRKREEESLGIAAASIGRDHNVAVQLQAEENLRAEERRKHEARMNAGSIAFINLLNQEEAAVERAIKDADTKASEELARKLERESAGRPSAGRPIAEGPRPAEAPAVRAHAARPSVGDANAEWDAVLAVADTTPAASAARHAAARPAAARPTVPATPLRPAAPAAPNRPATPAAPGNAGAQAPDFAATLSDLEARLAGMGVLPSAPIAQAVQGVILSEAELQKELEECLSTGRESQFYAEAQARLKQFKDALKLDNLEISDIFKVDPITLELIRDPVAFYCPDAQAYEYVERSSAAKMMQNARRGVLTGPTLNRPLNIAFIDANTPSTFGENPSQDKAVAIMQAIQDIFNILAITPVPKKEARRPSPRP